MHNAVRPDHLLWLHPFMAGQGSHSIIMPDAGVLLQPLSAGSLNVLISAGKHQGLSKAGVVHKRERMGLSSNAMPKSASTTTLSAIGSRAQANWELIRMHFLDFPKEAKQHIRQQWYSAVDGVMTQRQEAKQMEFQIQGRTPHNRHASGLQFANTLVDVNA